jgi:ubiquinone/menaquinone biosynthesis C-methylase UbiE
MENKKAIAKKTKDIYIEQHKKYTEDNVIFERFYKMVSDPSYFHLTADDFKGKNILDAGCGNTTYFQIAMLDYGVNKITCLDLGEDWIPHLKDSLIKKNADMSRVEFVSGSTTDLPFEDEKFDMVFSNGVIMHLVDIGEIESAFKELSRVTKKGGYLYTVLGNPGGLLEQKIFPAVREYYNENAEFKDFIDNINLSDVDNTVDKVNTVLKMFGLMEFDKNIIRSMFDLDYLTYLQNVIQVPTRHIMYMDEKWALNKFSEAGFEEPKRCKRFVVRKNIRQFLAPLQYDTNIKIASILFGPGNLEYISRKK